jgi:hypothetical protein
MYCTNNDFYNNFYLSFDNTNIIQNLQIYPNIYLPEHINMSNNKWNKINKKNL